MNSYINDTVYKNSSKTLLSSLLILGSNGETHESKDVLCNSSAI